MKLLTFLADRFSWEPFSRTLEDARDDVAGAAVEDCVVVFFHAEARDQDEEREGKVFKKTLKHIKWLANKMEFKNVVLHSFTHLGGEGGDAAFAESSRSSWRGACRRPDITCRARRFGWFCSWDISVRGESLAKVWKEV